MRRRTAGPANPGRGPATVAVFGTSRLEAFSDGVMAVIITITALSLKAPDGSSFSALGHRLPALLVYILSFAFVGIYWNNHHHMLRASDGVDGRAMWANLHLLFWLSLVPFTTRWMGENPSAAGPTALYGFVLLMCGFAYTLLQNALQAVNGPDSAFTKAVQGDLKGKMSLAFYVCAIGLAFVSTILSDVLYVVVAITWFIPDRRFESVISGRG